MGFRYQKRVNLGDGVGINVSKTGISTSYRTKYGSISPKGFTLKTGIPGLSFRSSFGRAKGKNDAIILLLAWMIVGAFLLATLILYNLIRLIFWLGTELLHFGLRKYYQHKEKKEQVQSTLNSDEK